mgnify:CR=1 FL=1
MSVVGYISREDAASDSMVSESALSKSCRGCLCREDAGDDSLVSHSALS